MPTATRSRSSASSRTSKRPARAKPTKSRGKPAGGAPFEMPPLPAEHAATQKVAERLVALMSKGKNLDAMRELYANNARHVEVMGGPGCDRIIAGKRALLEKAAQFERCTTIHDASVGTPIVNGDQFVVPMSLDCTSTEGPMANMRMQISETALYTVANGKISEGKFFYSCG